MAQPIPDPDWQAPIDASSNYLPRWSPDGTRLLFYRRLPDGWRIFLVNVDGTGLRQLSHGPGNDYQPAWSPDGTWIAFDSDRGGNRDIFRLNIESGELHQVTSHPARDVMPAWSPDGQYILFVSDRADGNQLWLTTGQGDAATRVTRQMPGPSILRPAWSPDGNRIAFVAADAQERRRIYIVNRNGDQLRAVTPPGDAGNAVWSPDGRHLAFDASPEGKDDSSTGGWELWTVRADGSGLRRLTSDQVNDWGPSWSPDGRELSFSRGRNDQYEVYRLDIAGARFRRVTGNVFR